MVDMRQTIPLEDIICPICGKIGQLKITRPWIKIGIVNEYARIDHYRTKRHRKYSHMCYIGKVVNGVIRYNEWVKRVY